VMLRIARRQDRRVISCCVDPVVLISCQAIGLDAEDRSQ
jgi:hypothetical protein